MLLDNRFGALLLWPDLVPLNQVPQSGQLILEGNELIEDGLQREVALGVALILQNFKGLLVLLLEEHRGLRLFTVS